MGKIILFNMITVDGYFAGPEGELDWHRVDSEFIDFAVNQLKEVKGLLFGRKTYELMASYWPTRDASENDPAVASKMNWLPKIVFSRTLETVSWENTRLVREGAVEEAARLKNHNDRDWLLLGSAELADTLSKHGLIDEYRLMVNAVILGKGIKLFKENENHLNLKLLRARTFQNGNVLLEYQTQES